MAYEVRLTPGAVRGLEDVVRSDAAAAERIRGALTALKDNPYPTGGESRPLQITKLSNGNWRARIGNYRIVYEIAVNVVTVVRVVHRKDAYRGM